LLANCAWLHAERLEVADSLTTIWKPAAMTRLGDRSAEEGIQKLLPYDRLDARIRRIFGTTGDRKLLKTFTLYGERKASLEAVSSSLMDNFRQYGNLEAYSLIYELNYRQFLLLIFKRLRSYHHVLDAKDILQDVFVSIYRYPHRFRDEKDNSFCNWSYSIIRNTILKHLKQRDVAPVSADTLDEILEDRNQVAPLTVLEQNESVERCSRVYLIFLLLYLRAFDMRLSEREKRALRLVEVDGLRYREAADELGIKLENLKMVICRARKKIFKTMHQMIGVEL
jgi:RNA polymerase sigma factor (sigma-70 family)